MSIIFYHDDEQKKLAVESRDRLQTETGRKIYTGIVPAAEFYPAEDYHQKYYLQQHPELKREFTSIYPDFDDFINSTAAARVNGYAGGYGTPDDLQEEVKSLGLSPEGTSLVQELIERGLAPACPVP